MRKFACLLAAAAVQAQTVSFQARTPVTLSNLDLQGPLTAVAADFDLDGKLDLAVPSQGGTSGIAVLAGNGDGTFQAPGPSRPARWPRRLSRLGRWPWPTLTATAGPISCSATGRPTRLSSCSPTAPETSALPGAPAGSDPMFLAVADFNGDSVPDVIALRGQSRDAVILLGNGDGTFRSAVAIPGVETPTTLGGRFQCRRQTGPGLRDRRRIHGRRLKRARNIPRPFCRTAACW